ncbi:MAG: monovalent cation/H+ antiporter complex subunit F [Phycisphaeraceae bacterium]
METAFLLAIIAVLLLLLPYVWRIAQGPTVFDRVQALNGIGTKVPVLLVLIGLLFQRADMFIDLALALFLLNLFTTLLVAKYMRRKASSIPQEGAS